jgi:hypothetical protein
LSGGFKSQTLIREKPLTSFKKIQLFSRPKPAGIILPGVRWVSQKKGKSF